MEKPASNATLIDVGMLQSLSPTMLAHILQMAKGGQIILFDPYDVSVIFESHLLAPIRDQSYISVADTCRLLNGEITIPGFERIGKINIM